jgi:hypothetical protein
MLFAPLVLPVFTGEDSDAWKARAVLDISRSAVISSEVVLDQGTLRVFSGGTYVHETRKCRSAAGSTIHPKNRCSEVGSRPVMPVVDGE